MVNIKYYYVLVETCHEFLQRLRLTIYVVNPSSMKRAIGAKKVIGAMIMVISAFFSAFLHNFLLN